MGWEELRIHPEEMTTENFQLDANLINTFAKAAADKAWYSSNKNINHFNVFEESYPWYLKPGETYGHKFLWGALRAVGQFRGYRNYRSLTAFNDYFNSRDDRLDASAVLGDDLKPSVKGFLLGNVTPKCFNDFMHPDLWKGFYRLWQAARYVPVTEFYGTNRKNYFNRVDKFNAGSLPEGYSFADTYSATDHENYVDLRCNVKTAGQEDSCPSGDIGTGGNIGNMTPQQAAQRYNLGVGNGLGSSGAKLTLRHRVNFSGFGGDVNQMFKYQESGFMSPGYDGRNAGSAYVYECFSPTDTERTTPITMKLATFGQVDSNYQYVSEHTNAAQSNAGWDAPLAGQPYSSNPGELGSNQQQSSTPTAYAEAFDIYIPTGTYRPVRDREKVALTNSFRQITSKYDGKTRTVSYFQCPQTRGLDLAFTQEYSLPASLDYSSNSASMDEHNTSYNPGSDTLEISYELRTHKFCEVTVKGNSRRSSDSSSKTEWLADLKTDGIDFLYD